jgi:hypothetical protein
MRFLALRLPDEPAASHARGRWFETSRTHRRSPGFYPKPVGGVASPRLLAPQHAAAPFDLIPQVWAPPALTVVKVPPGGVAWPLPLRPQQVTAPPVLIPQV